ncbi:hypothetical protein EXW48_26915 [Bacillus wiedmannii]|uniref:hypothetical protein n=1 Tax=Bacillus wiedmannii TaxID=1890302 RepID=UPI001C00EFEF|nr:hypothetical protein [Bacillus wiedmannii]QWI19393.1 hypothetical protein EXW48_26915 [Bacillus wiedmannii]
MRRKKDQTKLNREYNREDDHELNRSDFNHSKKRTKKINNNSFDQRNLIATIKEDQSNTIMIDGCCDLVRYDR